MGQKKMFTLVRFQGLNCMEEHVLTCVYIDVRHKR